MNRYFAVVSLFALSLVVMHSNAMTEKESVSPLLSAINSLNLSLNKIKNIEDAIKENFLEKLQSFTCEILKVSKEGTCSETELEQTIMFIDDLLTKAPSFGIGTANLLTVFSLRNEFKENVLKKLCKDVIHD